MTVNFNSEYRSEATSDKPLRYLTIKSYETFFLVPT